MLPHFATGSAERGSVSVPPPLHFRPPTGPIRDVVVEWTDIDERCKRMGRLRGDTPAKDAGLRYEQQAQNYIGEVLGFAYATSPVLHFRDDLGPRFCIPDGVYTHDGLVHNEDLYIALVEIKAQHCPEAWWQLKRLYEPVLRAWSGAKIVCLEVVKSYDPDTPFPCPFRLITDLKEWKKTPPEFSVFQWKK